MNSYQCWIVPRHLKLSTGTEFTEILKDVQEKNAVSTKGESS